MFGFFLNCLDDKAVKLHAGVGYLEIPAQYTTSSSAVFYHEHEWAKKPEYSSLGHYFCVSGWFIYKGSRNNLAQLAEDLILFGESVLAEMKMGSFVIYWYNSDTQVPKVISDPFGLSSHYIDTTCEYLKLSPSAFFLYDETRHNINLLHQEILNHKQHLFGNVTLYDGIVRLDPGCIIDICKSVKYHQIQPIKHKIEDIGEVFIEINSYWPQKLKILPISSGLDSRFILAHGQFEYGFTYGPLDSPEILTGESYSKEFSHYYSYDFSSVSVHEEERDILDMLSTGVLVPIKLLYSNYRHVSDHFSHAKVFFDGYLGDVLQRATYINPKGVIGELFKLFPICFKLVKFRAKTLLKLKYRSLSSAAFELVYQDFLARTHGLPLDDLQKVTYYEFIYARGGRYTVFGSNVLAAQFFTVVSPFAHIDVFNTFIQQDFSDGAQYKIMRSLWSKVDKRFLTRAVESGYKPTTPIILIPFIQLWYRLLFHFIPSRANYGVKLKRELKSNDRR
ncbi:hypothetical protein [Shewanella aestuarii]|uniref:Uncharacterized protein n=1 Tax=Shewanella aestuarii TaxID=1028752 RepID=A0A6G9QKV4_9GAMM|nr:hypothetical protein [Shewanella aestuarii]QIR15102.1 hypothetical protein HBH39_11925 [Shewanella aestuarii]